MPDTGDVARVLRVDSANTDDLARVHPWLDAETRHLPVAMRHGMGVALEEVVMNVTMHGGSSGAITVVMVSSTDAATLIVEDSGRAFDPTAAPAQEPPTSLADARPGGLGLILLRHYCKDISYARVGERNRLTLRFPLMPG